MNMKTSIITVVIIALGLSACAPTTTEVGRGKVTSLGKEKLIIENKGEILFLDLSATDRARLAPLEKGEQVTLLGKKAPASDNDSSSESFDVDEVVRANGDHIRMSNGRN